VRPDNSVRCATHNEVVSRSVASRVRAAERAAVPVSPGGTRGPAGAEAPGIDKVALPPSQPILPLPPGPGPHDELTEWTTAVLAAETLPAALPMSATPWPGRLVHPGGRRDLPGLFVRTTPRSRTGGIAAAPDPSGLAYYVHGLAGSSTNWTGLAGLLSDKAEGLAVDLPGSGRSDPALDADYSMNAHVTVLAEVLREVASEPVHLVGNSLGGVISTYLAARHPELIRSLTLISPAVPDLRMTRDRGADYRLAALLAPAVRNWVEPKLGAIQPRQRVAGLVALCFGDGSVVSAADRKAAEDEIAWRRTLPWTHRAALAELNGLMRSYLAAGARSYWGAARRVKVPTLVIWGTRDRLVDARLARRTAAAFERSSLLMLAGVGHVPQMEAPEPTARAIRQFWAGVES
jgi:pimeloyl-ACP methyl ester carboxylesterase